MDCEKFESLLIDELYGELDEVTSAAVRRHAAGCARCGALLSGLRATRKVAALPMEEPSIDLEDRILSAVREQQKVLPFRARASSVLSRAGAWAMRPQTAMAAVFLVVIGTSFVLVQSRKSMNTAGLSAEGMPVQAAATAAASGSAYAFDQKESAFAHGVEEKRLEQAPHAMPSTANEVAADDRERDKAKDELAKNDNDSNGMGKLTNAAPIAGDLTVTRSTTIAGGQGQAPPPMPGAGGGGASANGPYGNVQQNQDPALAAAKEAKQKSGCGTAAPMFDGLRGRAGVGGEATLEAARCYRALGNTDAARQRYASLANTPYAQQAQNELDSMTPAAARKAAPAQMEDVAAAQAQTQQRAQTHTARPTTPAATVTASPAQQAKPAEKGAATY